MTSNSQVDRFPSASVSVHLTSVVPRAKKLPDGATQILDNRDWEHPEVTDWLAPPHYQFKGDLTYICEYLNDTKDWLYDGTSARTDEMCMAVGYFFPADGPKQCINPPTF